MFAPFDTLEADAPRLKLEVIELAVHFVNELLVRVKLLLAVAVSPVKRFSLLLYAYTPTATTIPPPYALAPLEMLEAVPSEPELDVVDKELQLYNALPETV
jgi:hypothetical protein